MTVKFIIQKGLRSGEAFLCNEKDGEWVIGRDPSRCQFVLDDPKVSRQHAVVRREDKRYLLMNLSAANVTQVNGKPMEGEYVLQHGDCLRIGDEELLFEVNDKADSYRSVFEDGDDGSESILPPEKPPEEEESRYDTIFGDVVNDSEMTEVFHPVERFVLKVLSGPNTGAEFFMKKGKRYLIGTDIAGCDVIFNDLSVSRHHARITISSEDEVTIEDLGSRNGILVDGIRIDQPHLLSSQNIVTAGTTTFVILDREKGEDTLFTPPAAETETEEPAPASPEEKEKGFFLKKGLITESTFVITGILIAVILVVGTGSVMLFKTSPVERSMKDHTADIQKALDSFQEVRFTYNPATGVIFLTGHVLTNIENEELLYHLNNLPYIAGIDNNVVVDEFVWQEMNLILARNPAWRGVGIYATAPGNFVVSGYLTTREEGASLTDYLNIQFPYVDHLTNAVVIEEDLYQDILTKLQNYGFYNVKVDLVNGEVSLSGYLGLPFENTLNRVVGEIKEIRGVRSVNNYVVIIGTGPKTGISTEKSGDTAAIDAILNSDESPAVKAEKIRKFYPQLKKDGNVIDLTAPIPGDVSATYTITGYAAQGSIGRAVEINGQILTVGDMLGGMVIFLIHDRTVFLENNGLKYKIEFNDGNP